MKNCFSCCMKYLNLNKCIKHYINISEDQDSSPKNQNNRKIIILQKSSSNNFNIQGDYTKLENYDLFQKFLKIPLVQIYIEEVFRPNKEIKPFQIEKIKGIFKKIESLLYQLFTRIGLELVIPKTKSSLKSLTFDIDGDPPSQSDLDCYTPILFMEFWIYGKTFIKKSKLKKIILLHNINYTNSESTQDRAGCPEYDITKSISFAIREKNLAYIRIVLHHELFHFIDYADDQEFEDEGWDELNQEGFEYGEGGDTEREWIKLEKNVMGFINHYSTSALEEDRAEIYQYLISCPDEALNNNDIIVSKKAKRIQKFLNEFDKKGIGDEKNNFWANLIDYRQRYVYKEKVFQGNILKGNVLHS